MTPRDATQRDPEQRRQLTPRLDVARIPTACAALRLPGSAARASLCRFASERRASVRSAPLNYRPTGSPTGRDWPDRSPAARRASADSARSPATRATARERVSGLRPFTRLALGALAGLFQSHPAVAGSQFRPSARQGLTPTSFAVSRSARRGATRPSTRARSPRGAALRFATAPHSPPRAGSASRAAASPPFGSQPARHDRPQRFAFAGASRSPHLRASPLRFEERRAGCRAAFCCPLSAFLTSTP